jgi:paraquat-inducible protein B
VGDVQSVRLAPDHQGVDVKVRLDRNAEFLACEGSVFWIVRPEITMEGVRGLGTILSGSHIEVNPGSGKQKREFVGAEKSPGTSREGLKLVLMAGSLGFVKPTSAVLYRGIEVGEVEKVDLSADSRTVDIHVLIHEPYARLVRPETRFWNAGGVDFNFGLFSGLEVSAETFKSLVAGGIAFATPESITSNTVSNGMLYRLHDRPEESWLKWSPSIELPGP